MQRGLTAPLFQVLLSSQPPGLSAGMKVFLLSLFQPCLALQHPLPGSHSFHLPASFYPVSELGTALRWCQRTLMAVPQTQNCADFMGSRQLTEDREDRGKTLRSTEWFGLERNFKDRLFHPPRMDCTR